MGPERPARERGIRNARLPNQRVQPHAPTQMSGAYFQGERTKQGPAGPTARCNALNARWVQGYSMVYHAS